MVRILILLVVLLQFIRPFYCTETIDSYTKKLDAMRFAPKNLKANSFFGHSIVSCNLTGSDNQYIAIGAPGYDRQKGAVYIYHSYDKYHFYKLEYDTFSKKGIGNNDNNLDKGITSDRFGHALECFDMNKDGYPDLIVGIPGRRVYPNTSYMGTG